MYLYLPPEGYWFESPPPPFGNSSLGTDFPFKIIAFKSSSLWDFHWPSIGQEGIIFGP